MKPGIALQFDTESLCWYLTPDRVAYLPLFLRPGTVPGLQFRAYGGEVAVSDQPDPVLVPLLQGYLCFHLQLPQWVELPLNWRDQLDTVLSSAIDDLIQNGVFSDGCGIGGDHAV